MSSITRYYFAKKTFPHHLVLIKKNDKYYTFKEDNNILEYIHFKDLRTLNRRKINYVIIDNNNDLKIKEFKDNQYELIYYKVMFLKLLKILMKLK